MGDLVMDAHRQKVPLDHPAQSVTADKMAALEHVTFALLTSDPPLAPGRWWIRIDTKELKYTLDGVEVHVIPLPFFPWSIDKYLDIFAQLTTIDSHDAISQSVVIPSITIDSHAATSISLTMPSLSLQSVLS